MSRATILFHEIETQRQAVLEEIESYEAERDALPKGSIRVIKRRYAYCFQRVNGKSTSEYLGMRDDPEVLERIGQIKKRKYLDAVIKELKAELKEIDAYYRVGLKFNG